MGSTGNALDKVFGIYILVAIVSGGILASTMSGLNTMIADTTNFTSGQIAMLGVLAVVILVAFIYLFLSFTGVVKK